MRTLAALRIVLGLLGVGALCAHDAETPAPADEVRARIEVLRAEIARHDELYFRRAAPVITDAEYDALKRELRAWLLAAGESDQGVNTIGDDRTGAFPTARHHVPMLGLEKSYSEAELRRFLQRTVAAAEQVAWIVEPKYDGLAISLTYARGRLQRAVTRGDGREGDEVTENLLLACAGLPRELRGDASSGPVPELVEIRGEVYVSRTEFARLNAERRSAAAPEFAHPRNLAVGTLKSRDPALLRGRQLSFVAYAWGAWEPSDAAPTAQEEWYARLRAWGFEVPPGERASGPEAVVSAVQRFAQRRPQFPAPLDGAVVKVDAVAQRRQLGESDSAPRWAVAQKFEPERAETRLRAITWQVGRTGLVTPVAELEPVAVGGATIARASLHNAREIARRDYRVGDWVHVERAGEVVPQLVGVNLARRPPEAAPYSPPTICPGCGTALVAVGDAQVRCPNRGCPPQVQRRLEHAASPEALNLPGFGPALLADLIARGRLRRVEDFFGLGGADVSPALTAVIERSRRGETWRFVAALGLPEVGPAGARRLGERFPDLAELAETDVAALRGAGLGAGAAAAAHEALATPELQRTVRALSAVRVAEDGGAARGRLAGKRFVFTGTLGSLTREAAIARVRAAGGEVQSAVTRQTDFVVAGEGGGRKLDEARRLGRRVLTAQEFLDLLGHP